MTSGSGVRLAFVLALLTWGGAVALLSGPPSKAKNSIRKHKSDGYVSSGACVSCHPGEHDSWQKTYHRSMTRQVSELSWDGTSSPRLPVLLSLYDRTFKLQKLGENIVYEGPDLQEIGAQLPNIRRTADASEKWIARRSRELFYNAQEVTRQLTLVTGSHHYLAFWINGDEGDELRQLPFVYLLDEKRFLKRRDAFLQPPEALPHLARWNANCIQCHAVAGKPGQTEGRAKETGDFWTSYDTRVAELGIACEACHGPGRKHSQYYRNPWARHEARQDETVEGIFVPDEHSGTVASEACGQCHSYFVPKDPNQWWTSGFSKSFQAGQPLKESRLLLRAEALLNNQSLGFTLSPHRSSIFWDDGSMIVGGREYNGLTSSPCYENGQGDRKLGCTSCHSLHQGDANDQLRRDLPGNKMCTQCHEGISEAHSGHQSTSPGAVCINCHMPRTSYALLQGIASHQISSPSSSLRKPPNACSLCHIDRPPAWIQSGRHRPSANDTTQRSDAEPTGEDSVPVAVRSAVSGNAVERAIYAYALGTPEVQQTTSSPLVEQLLEHLTEDPYAAVRLIAERSMRRRRSLSKSMPAGLSSAPEPAILSDETLRKLTEERDNSPIVISE